jgi:hypothetical protein
VIGGLKPSAKKNTTDKDLQSEKTKDSNNKKGGSGVGCGARKLSAQVDTFSAPSSFHISTSLSIFFGWVDSKRSPHAAFSFNSSIAFS